MADVILFHSVLGLRPVERKAADRLRAAGHDVTTPDLYAGEVAATLDEGFALNDRIGWSVVERRARDAARERPTRTVLMGFSMGAAVVDALLPDPAGWHARANSAGAAAEVFTYPGAGHFYLDADLPDHDEQATALTWRRVLEFLRTVRTTPRR